METIQINTWKEFEPKIAELSREAVTHRGEKGYKSAPLFRGLEDNGWELSTTLERWGCSKMKLSEYVDRTDKSYKELKEALTLHRIGWEPATAEIDYPLLKGLPNMPFLAYLRHHGYPSPLMDWSRSALIAAAFAFLPRPKKLEPGEPEPSVAVFVYQEYVGQGKYFHGRIGSIWAVECCGKIHTRHKNQQSAYTFCIKEQNGSVIFCPHQERFDQNTGFAGKTTQDRLTKITIPISQRRSALRDLFSKGITPTLLFDSEESKVHTAALNAMDDL